MPEVIVCMGCCCPQNGGAEVLKELSKIQQEEHITKQKETNQFSEQQKTDIKLFTSGCVGPCEKAPNVIIDGVLHSKVQIEEIRTLLQLQVESPSVPH